MNENEPLTRRNVLKATAATLGASVGVASVAGADVEPNALYPIGDCVVTNADAEAYDECPGQDPVTTIPEGWSGTVVENCVTDNHVHWVAVEWECERIWFVDPAYISRSMNCPC